LRDLFFLSCGGFVAPRVALQPLGKGGLKATRLTNTVAVVVRENGDVVLVDAGWDAATCASPARELGRVRKAALGLRVRAEDAIALQLRAL
jgi:hypothetical protein